MAGKTASAGRKSGGKKAVSRSTKAGLQFPVGRIARFLKKGDRTVDQMVQAARSGKKNILEGSKASLTSKETEIKLTNVGRASLEELLDDYKDFLRARDLPLWDKASKEAQFVRRLGHKLACNYTYACPDIFELADGDFAIIGSDMTHEAENLPPDAGCAPHERIVRIPRQLLIQAKADIPNS